VITKALPSAQTAAGAGAVIVIAVVGTLFAVRRFSWSPSQI